MNITNEKQNIVRWIKGLHDEKTIEKILTLKEKNQISEFEQQLLEKGLNDILLGNVFSHEEVKNRFENRFTKINS